MRIHQNIVLRFISTLFFAPVLLACNVEPKHSGSPNQDIKAQQQSSEVAAEDLPHNANQNGTAPQQIDPDPVKTDYPIVVSQSDITVLGKPACAFTIRYPNYVDQDVTWREEPCSAVRTQFLSFDAIRKSRKSVSLNTETITDIQKLKSGGVFYAESKLRTAIFPVNVAGVAYEIPLTE